MYKRERNLIIEQIDNLSEILTNLNKVDYSNQITQAVVLSIEIHKKLYTSCDKYNAKHIQSIINSLEYLNENFEQASIKDIKRAIKKQLFILKGFVNSQHLRYKIFFFPYIASMWTALESVWKAADADPDCDAYVVPIPYWNLKLEQAGSPVKKDLVYEGDRYPEYVTIIDYQNISLEIEQPDMVFIHNPYDDYNTLTRIPEQFYTRNIRPHTDMLIYSPYNVPYNVPISQMAGMMPSFNIVDKILFASKHTADWFISSGLKKEKALILGSPKLDAIISPLGANVIPNQWLRKSEGKKVILLNSHFYGFLTRYKFYEKHGINYMFEFVAQIVALLANNKDAMLLWRPHPLMFNMLESRGCYGLLNTLKEMVVFVEKSGGIVDFSYDYFPAFQLSDALISFDGSSLLTEYLFTGKPITEAANYFERNEENNSAIPNIRASLYSAKDVLREESFKELLLLELYRYHIEGYVKELKNEIPFFCKYYCDENEVEPKNIDDLINNYINPLIDSGDIANKWKKLYRELFNNFILMVCSGKDELKQNRSQAVNSYFANTTGTCGQDVYSYLKKQ